MDVQATRCDTAGQAVPTDALLIQAMLPETSEASLAEMLRQLGSAVTTESISLHAAFCPAQSTFYAYLHFAERTLLGKASAAALETSLRKQWPQWQDLKVSRLERVFDAAGASAKLAASCHYVVEMDPERSPDQDWMPALSEWYDTEHMPGLAKVAGCVRASRYLNHDHGPLSLACYDLVTEETTNTAPWLAVRGTEWSSRMRPHFTNTRRTVFDLLTAGSLATST